MAPKPQEQTALEPELTPLIPDDERVVISGISGLFPDSRNVKDLSKILYNKVNPISAENVRYKYSHPEVPQCGGKVPDVDRFDAQFFKVHYWLAKSMDSMSRKILEQSYQAIYDAGLSPEHLSGKKVGVYIGTSFSETEKAAFYVSTSKTGFGIAGCTKTMFANRISYWLNAKGPSISIDGACCSSIAALEQAYSAINRGECEAAIVGGANLCLHPQSSVHFARIMKLSKDGATRSFDKNADGCIKSEAINVLFLQKAKNALRIYADVMHVKTEYTSILTDASGPRYGFYRDPDLVRTFLTNFYNEARIHPQEVQYVEAFGCAVPESDKAELEAVSEIFCENRDNQLLVGSVMSNIGYGEAASGISAVTKILLAYETGKLAANLNCPSPRNDVPAIKDGKIKIVNEHESFEPTYTAVNSMSFTGLNAHILLHGRHKPKDLNRYKSSIPQLVTISARQDSGVKRVFLDLKSRPVDPEELALFRNIHQTRIAGHMGRGYIILDSDETNGQSTVVSEKHDYFDEAKRPLWFVYSGMGSQWTGMGKELMKIPIFAAAIEKCHRVLEPKGLDIVNILTSSDKTMFDNILHSFVGIAAVQIGLTDILKEVGIVPDNIIGHSVGELGCAYADGCFTAEETILSAYSRGLVSLQTPFIKGSMAAVGLGYQQVIGLCPPGVEVACHNSAESSTISGPADVMKQFVAELTAKGVFAREVPCSNIAYHSKYIAEAGPGLLKYLREVIKSPKKRSERWLSTSVPQKRWSEQLAQYSSPEYHTNNLLNPVLFEETSALIPPDAVLVEVAPHGLLQAILKRSLPSSCAHIALTRRGHSDNSHMVLESIGKLFMEGYNPKIAALYPKVEFPVSTGTPMLNHLVEWAHHDQWSLPLYVSATRKVAASSKFIVSLHDDEHKFIKGNIIRGRTKYPFAACLVACWDTLAMSLGVQRKKVSVKFTDLKLYGQPIMHDSRQLKLNVALHRGTGKFEIMDEDFKVATGYIVADTLDLTLEFSKKFQSDDDLVLDQDVIYQLLGERDYEYKDDFRSIQNANSAFTNAQIAWNNNWTTFIDGILQLNALRQSHDGVSEPSLIGRLCIDVEEHSARLLTVGNRTVAVANVFEKYELTRCGGVIIENVKYTNLPAMKINEVAINSQKFFPRFQSGIIDIPTALYIYLQLVSENIGSHDINVIEIATQGLDSQVSGVLSKVIKEIPKIRVNYKKIEKTTGLNNTVQDLAAVDLIIVKSLTFDENLYRTLYNGLRPDTFILQVKPKDIEIKSANLSELYRVVSCYETNEILLELLKWRPTTPSPSTTAVTVRRQSDIKSIISARHDIPASQKLIIFSSYPILTGLKDLVKKWRAEAEKNQVFLLAFDEKDANNIFDQLPELDLAFNILTQGIWGGDYFVPCLKSLNMETKVTLQSSRVNDLESLEWVEAPEMKSGGIPVQVHFAGLNDLDGKRAVGLLPFKYCNELGQTYYGMDFSGVTQSGDRVMGIVHGGAASNKVLAIPELLWPVPQHWTLEDAVTVPLPYAHAFYILAIKSFLIRGMKILIHAGTGALGQALISIALANGCKVFTTVSDIKKKKFLKRLFPDLKEEYIGNSRDASFQDMVMNHTEGKGVRIVVSCLKGELKNVSLKCLGCQGVFIDTNQLPTQDDFSLGMDHMSLERNYIATDFTSVIDNPRRDEILKIQNLMVEGIRKGYVRPLSRLTYNASEVSRAFALLSGARHRGRAVLHVAGDVLNVPRLVCSSRSMQVVIVDDMPFGRQVCDRFVLRGAKHLAVCAKTESNHLKYKIRQWQQQGTQVLLTTELLNSEQKVTSILQGAAQIAPIEAVYIVSDEAKKTETLNYLDNVTRKMAGIKHFVIVGSENGIGEDVCIQRRGNKLPASLIELPHVQQVPHKTGATNESVFWRNALDSMERGVKSEETVVTVVAKHGSNNTLLEEILDKANISLPISVRDTTTLQELGLDACKVPIIATFLRNEHSVQLTDELILNLTIQKIKDMNQIVSESEFKSVKGFGNFFNYVDPDELLATTEMVFLPTLSSSASMRDDEFDVSNTYFCIVPGMEGHHERFRTLCERLKLPAMVLQPGYDRFEETPKDMATRFAKLLLTKAEIAKHHQFYLLGYESGVVVALELAAILEDQGLTGTVYCIGTSPKELKCLVEKQLTSYASEDALNEEVLRYMFELMGGSINDELDAALEKTTIWEEKLDICIGNLLGSVSHSSQYAKMLIKAACARLKMTAKYEIIPRQLKSQIVLLQAATEDPMPNTLQEHSELPISVYKLRAPLAQAALDLRCAAVINRHLHTELLDAFEEKNLCETYLLNPNTFMSTANLGN